MELSRLVIGVFLGMGTILGLVAVLDEAKLAPPADDVLPVQFRQAWRT
jgi:hypothetical protein